METKLLAAWSPQAVTIGASLETYIYESSSSSLDPWLLRDLSAHQLSKQVAVAEIKKLVLAQRATALAYAIATETTSPALGELILADASAAWVWAGGLPPQTFTTCATHRINLKNSGTHRKLNLSAKEILVVGGIPVMHPVRAFIELTKNTKPGADHKEFAARLTHTGWVNEKQATQYQQQQQVKAKAEAVYSWK